MAFGTDETNPSEVPRVSQPKVLRDLGIMRARVEASNDPWGIGRIRVRVPGLHGAADVSEKLKPEECPWAMPCTFGGSGQDLGSYVVPLPGSFVWVMFEENDTNRPVWLGGCPDMGGEVARPMNQLVEEEQTMQKWNTKPSAASIPNDIFDGGHGEKMPTRHIIYKSQKGHSIYMEDKDGQEEFTLVDRIGQQITFYCPVDKGKNANNANPRNLARAEKNTQLQVANNPSIVVKTGNANHSKLQMWQDKTILEVVGGSTSRITMTPDQILATSTVITLRASSSLNLHGGGSYIIINGGITFSVHPNCPGCCC